MRIPSLSLLALHHPINPSAQGLVGSKSKSRAPAPGFKGLPVAAPAAVSHALPPSKGVPAFASAPTPETPEMAAAPAVQSDAPVAPVLPSSLPVGPAFPAPTEAQLDSIHLALESVTIPTGDALRAILTAGRPFPSPIDARMQAIFGMPVTHEGFERLFTPLLPSATFVVSEMRAMDHETVSFMLSALERTGRVVMQVVANFARHADGSIEFFCSDAEVEEDYRGTALTARSELLQESMMREASSHPESRLCLQGGYADNANTGARDRAIGTYLHAIRGYLFAESLGVDSEFYETDGKRSERDVGALDKLSDRDLMLEHFWHWIDHEPTLQYNGHALDDEARAILTKKLNRCVHPGQFAIVKVPGLTVEISAPGREPVRTEEIGRTYMLSGTAPIWRGLRYVNPAKEGAGVVETITRQLSAQALQDETQQEITRANKKLAAQRAKILEGIKSADATVRAEAYQAIGLHCDAAARPFLVDRLQHEVDPKVKKTLELALGLMDNLYIEPALEAASRDMTRTQEVRDSMRERLEVFRVEHPSAPAMPLAA